MAMTPEEIEESKKGLRQAEEEKPKWTGKWDTGYRGWSLKFKEGQPRLGSVVHSGHWEPHEGGEVVSDWDPEVDVPFEETPKGLYSLRDWKELRKRYGGEDVYGAIMPYGKTFPGEAGFRSEKAIVTALFRAAVPCYICKKTAKVYVHNDEKFALCGTCLTRLEKLIRAKGYTDEEIEEVLRRLAEIYDAEVTDAPGDV